MVLLHSIHYVRKYCFQTAMQGIKRLNAEQTLALTRQPYASNSRDESFIIPEIITGISSDDDIHPHFKTPKGTSRTKRSRTVERPPARERLPSQGDPFDPSRPEFYHYL